MEEGKDRQARRREQHPHDGRHPRAEVVCGAAGEGRDHAEGDRHDAQLEAGDRGAQLLRPVFQVEGDGIERPEHHHVGEQAARDAGGEGDPPEEAEVERRGRCPPLPEQEEAAQDGAAGEQEGDLRGQPAVAVGEGGDGQQESRDRRYEETQPDPVESGSPLEVAAARDQEPGQHAGDDPHRQVDEEDEPPSAERD